MIVRRLMAVVVLATLLSAGCGDGANPSVKHRALPERTPTPVSSAVQAADSPIPANRDGSPIVAEDLNVSIVRVSLPGAGSIVASGTADRLDVVVAGAAWLDGPISRPTGPTESTNNLKASRLRVHLITQRPGSAPRSAPATQTGTLSTMTAVRDAGTGVVRPARSSAPRPVDRSPARQPREPDQGRRTTDRRPGRTGDRWRRSPSRTLRGQCRSDR